MRMALGSWGLALLGVVALLAPSRLHAQKVITLSELERKAVQNRPALDGDAAAVRGAQAEVDRALAGYYPVVSLETKTSVSPGNEIRDLPNDPDYSIVATKKGLGLEALQPVVRYGTGLEARMSLYDFGRTSASVEASRAKRAAVQAGRDVTRLQIVRGVRASYLGWLGAYELLSVTERALTDAKERSARVAALIGEGMRPQADLTPVRSDELLAQLELERARGDVAKRKMVLEHAIGAPLPDDAVPDRKLLDQGTNSAASADDPELRALQLEQNASQKAAYALDQGDNATLGAIGSVGVHGQNTSLFPNYSVGLGLSVPLWDGGADNASARAARARADAVDAKIREHQLAQDQERQEAALDASNAAQRLAMAEALLASTTAQLEEAEARYDLGGGGIEPIAVARAMMRRAQTELLLAKIARVEAALRVLPP